VDEFAAPYSEAELEAGLGFTGFADREGSIARLGGLDRLFGREGGQTWATRAGVERAQAKSAGGREFARQETRSAFISGRVKQAKSPQRWSLIPEDMSGLGFFLGEIFDVGEAFEVDVLGPEGRILV